jgi:CXXC-20-CXXC protein
MIKECSNCTSKITFLEYYKQFIKNRYQYTCKECGAMYKATTLSIILNFIVMVIPTIYIGIKNLISLNIIWIIIWGFLLQPLILLYKNMDTTKGS